MYLLRFRNILFAILKIGNVLLQSSKIKPFLTSAVLLKDDMRNSK